MQLKKRQPPATEEEFASLKAAYRDKTNKADLEVYNDIQSTTESFFTNKKLKEIFHGNNTQMNESMMHVVTKYVPKGSHFCRTICGMGRVFTACSVNSVGLKEFYNRLCLLLGVRMHATTERFCERTDEKAKYRKYHSELPTSKARRKRREYKSLQDQIQQDKQSRLDGTYYKIRGSGSKKRKSGEGCDGGEGVKKSGCCKWCGLDTHQRITSKLCPYNKSNVEKSTSGADPKRIKSSSDDVT